MANENRPDLKVWTSHMIRTIETAEHIKCSRIEHWKALDELNGVSNLMLNLLVNISKHRLFISRIYLSF